jgi:YD repeat-containing protein
MTTRFKTWKKTLLLLAAVPGLCLALSSGPAMPEYNDFESVENPDMVNLSTGDFSYSIPVMTVPGPGLGFPLNLSYHAGITPEQEASWVGLGWNLQAGAVTRQINNLPDDFKGTLIEERVKSQHIHGWYASASWGPATVGISWDTEVGTGGMVGIGLKIPSTPFGVGVQAGVNGVFEGIGISLSAGIPVGPAGPGGLQGGANMSIGVHSKRGVTQGISASASIKQGSGPDNKYFSSNSLSLGSIGVSLSSKTGVSAGASAGMGASSSASLKGNVFSTSSSGFLPVPTPWGPVMLGWGTWDVYIDGLQEDRYYGFLHLDTASMGCRSSDPASCYRTTEQYEDRCKGCETKYRNKKMDYNNGEEYSLLADESQEHWFQMGYTGEDIYAVQTQGMSGSFKPYRPEDGDYYSFLSNQDYNYQATCLGFAGWLGRKCRRISTTEYEKMMEGGFTLSSVFLSQRNLHSTNSSRYENLVWRFNEESGGGLYTNPANRDTGAVVAAASKKIEPLYNANKKIAGWVLTSVDGVRYIYGYAQYNYFLQNISSAEANLSNWTRRETPAYAYAWLLKAILSPDYVATAGGTRDTVEGVTGPVRYPKQGDIGGWVLFKYTPRQTAGWMSPVGRVSDPTSFSVGAKIPSSSLPKPEGYTASLGIKSIAYLDTVETPTHFARMDIAAEGRDDAIPPLLDSLGFNADYQSLGSVSPSLSCPLNTLVLQRFDYRIKVPKEDLPDNTPVSIVIRRKSWVIKKKYDSFWYKVLNVEPIPYCKETTKEEIVHTAQVDNDFGDAQNYWIDLPQATTEISHVRVVLGGSENAPGSASRLSYLKGITLYNKATGTEVSAVRFTYNYSLATETPNSESSLLTDDGGYKGRLTLKSVHLGATSGGPWNPPYLFDYHDVSTAYNADKKDYWGYYCNTCSQSKRVPDGSAAKWNLKRVTTPAGGEIEVAYEPKRIHYSEAIPTVFDGDDVGQYFTVDNQTLTVNNDVGNARGLPFDARPLIDARRIPQEVATNFHSKYVSFVGRFDLRHNSEDIANMNLHSVITRLGTPSYYLLEMPGLFAQMGSDKRLYYGLTDPSTVSGATTLTSSRVSCPSGWSCSRYVGLTSTSAFTDVKYLHARKDYFGPPLSQYLFHAIWKDPIWARLWAVYESNPTPTADAAPFGGGVRVSRVTFVEPLTSRQHSIRYSYDEGATPTQPGTLSNYSLGIRASQVSGEKAYLGSPNVLYGKVRTSHYVGEAFQYASEYRFITSKDLPVLIRSSKVSTTGLHSQVRILDRSALWGSLWRKTDYTGSNAVARVEKTKWSARLNDTWKSLLGLTGTDLNLVKDGETVLEANDTEMKVFAANSVQSQYFGVSQKLWSNRFVPWQCDALEEENKQACILSAGGVQSTQIGVIRIAPFVRRSTITQDGLPQATENNLFDFLTAEPLLQIQRNRKPNGSDEYYATLKSLTHHHEAADAVYAGMTARNMLSQEFSTTVFRFDSDPASKDFTSLSSGDLRKVVASEFTTWKDAKAGDSVQYRKYETFNLKDTVGYMFALPTPSTETHPHYRSGGKYEEYDAFGHPVDFKNALGVHNAQIFGYGEALPTAFAANAKRDQVYYQSFELTNELGLIGGWGVVTPARSYTGSHSLLSRNCLETGVPAKAGCGSSWASMFPLRDLEFNQTYVASAWYYDDYAGSNPDNVNDSTILKYATDVTRPGIFIGGDGATCGVSSHPNGAFHNPGNEPPAANGAWNADQRATGSKTWKRIWVEFTPTSANCSGSKVTNAQVWLYASKWRAGSDVYYDELRVRPKKSLMTTYAYNDRGNLISTADANEIPKHFEYDVFGNLSGTRDTKGNLVQEQGKTLGLRKVSAGFDWRAASRDTVCHFPDFYDVRGREITEAYTLLSVENTKIAWIKNDSTSQKVCTADRGGTTQVRLRTTRGVHTVPITVGGAVSSMPGTQLAMTDLSCTLSGYNICQFDLTAIKNRLAARGETPRGWVFDLEFKNAKQAPSYALDCFMGHSAPLAMKFPSDGDGCDNFPARAFHVRFTHFAGVPSGLAGTLATPAVSTNDLGLPFGLSHQRIAKLTNGPYHSILGKTTVFDGNWQAFPSYTAFRNAAIAGTLGIKTVISLAPNELIALDAATTGNNLIGLQIAHHASPGMTPLCMMPVCSSGHGADNPAAVAKVRVWAY